jgi:hypothetical protein
MTEEVVNPGDHTNSMCLIQPMAVFSSIKVVHFGVIIF